MKYEDLDCKQLEVVKCVLETDCKAMVLGGAGTGKTTTALWCARKLLEQTAVTPKPRVLFMTFSRSAVSQIMRRAPGIISGYTGNIEILTFHSLAYRLFVSFGRYAGYGKTLPSIQSEAQRKLLGQQPGLLTYDDLLPNAIKILGSPEIRRLLSSRWCLVICDEVQDTNEEQWNLIQLLAPRKLLLLGDPNQMIYAFRGASPERFREIQASVDSVIKLRPASYRDPSGAIPALAEAVRVRQFTDEAILQALRTKRLVVLKAEDEVDFHTLVCDQIAFHPHKEIGVFAHSNSSVADLADRLNEAGVDHVLVGIPESHGEALSAMAIQCSYAIGLATSEDIRTCLAIYLTSIVRGQPPELAFALTGRSDLPEEIDTALRQLEIALKACSDGTIADLLSVVTQSWLRLRITRGARPWQRAASHLNRLTYSTRNELVSVATVERLKKLVERSRIEALIDLNYSEHGKIQLMNYHQTKGREADVVIHVFYGNDYFGRDSEPFEESSRLLNVALSRARERVIIILPPNPHPLVEPFVTLILNT